jgi:DNA-binding response OmpR family regulator
MRVLLIDDNEELREFLALCLTEDSIEVVDVGTPPEALAKVENGKFDAFIVDSILGQHDGLTLVSELKATKNGKSVPVMLMSSISTALARRVAQSSGCDEFLVKPFGHLQFIEQVKALQKVKR